MEDARHFACRFGGPEGLALDLATVPAPVAMTCVEPAAPAVIDSIDDCPGLPEPVLRSPGR